MNRYKVRRSPRPCSAMRAQRCSILREREGLDEYDEIRRDLDLLDERIATLQEWRRDALRSLRELIAKRRAWAV